MRGFKVLWRKWCNWYYYGVTDLSKLPSVPSHQSSYNMKRNGKCGECGLAPCKICSHCDGCEAGCCVCVIEGSTGFIVSSYPWDQSINTQQYFINMDPYNTMYRVGDTIIINTPTRFI